MIDYKELFVFFKNRDIILNKAEDITSEMKTKKMQLNPNFSTNGLRIYEYINNIPFNETYNKFNSYGYISLGMEILHPLFNKVLSVLLQIKKEIIDSISSLKYTYGLRLVNNTYEIIKTNKEGKDDALYYGNDALKLMIESIDLIKIKEELENKKLTDETQKFRYYIVSQLLAFNFNLKDAFIDKLIIIPFTYEMFKNDINLEYELYLLNSYYNNLIYRIKRIEKQNTLNAPFLVIENEKTLLKRKVDLIIDYCIKNKVNISLHV